MFRIRIRIFIVIVLKGQQHCVNVKDISVCTVCNSFPLTDKQRGEKVMKQEDLIFQEQNIAFLL